MATLDLNEFRGASFETRTRIVKMPSIAKAFELEEVTITVRGLTADEIARARSRKDRGKLAIGLAQAMIGGEVRAATEQAAGIIGHDPDITAEVAEQIEMLTAATIEPEGVTVADVAAWSEHYPIDFKEAWLAVMDLTGLGKIRAGSQDCGQAAPADPA